MRLRYQRLLYLSFISFFVIVLPLIILYATGYRYNVKKHRLEKTGIIVIESNPPGATIRLNDREIGVTPRRVLGIRPDEYTVTLTRAGYFPWEKSLTVSSNATSFANNITLFRQSQPELKIAGEISLFSANPNRTFLLAAVKNSDTIDHTVYATDLRTLVTTPIETLPVATTSALAFGGWSAQANYAAMYTATTTEQTFIFDSQFQTLTPLSRITTQSFTDLHWDSQNPSRLYLLNDKSLTQIDLDTRTSRTLAVGPFTDIQIHGQTIYTLQSDPEGTVLARYATDQPQIVVAAVRLPTAGPYRFGPTERNLITITNAATRELLVITPDVFGDAPIAEHILFQGRADAAHWSSNGSRLLLQNDVELSIVDPQTHAQETITRHSAPILDADWYTDGAHIIYRLDNSIRTIEALSNSKNNLVLATLDELSGLALSTSGDVLYLPGRLGDQVGVFTLQLK
jgi:hypothetical protein